MPWQPIGRDKPDIVGVHATDSARLDVTIPLDADPPPEWAAFFLSPSRVRLDPAIAAPALDGRLIRVQPLDVDLETCVRLVDDRIAAANGHYANEVVPRLRAQPQRDERDDARREQRLVQARTRAGQL